jgi:hypothetical protein
MVYVFSHKIGFGQIPNFHYKAVEFDENKEIGLISHPHF